MSKAGVKVGEINLFGEIYSDDWEGAESWGIIGTSYVSKMLEEHKDCDELILNIKSNGGSVYEGWAMYALLIKSGKIKANEVRGMQR